MDIKFASMVSYVAPHVWKHDSLKVNSRLFGFEIRDEYFSGGKCGLRRPILWRCQSKKTCPLVVRRKDFEHFGHWPRFVTFQEFAYSNNDEKN